MERMDKPKLLDLFCGGDLLQYNNCGIIRIWLQLHVSIAERFSNHGEGLVNIVQWLVRIILTGQQKRLVHAVNVGRQFSSKVLSMPIGNIVHKLALKKQTQNILWRGMRHTLELWQLIMQPALLRTQGHGEKSITMNAVKLSEYWGANV